MTFDKNIPSQMKAGQLATSKERHSFLVKSKTETVLRATHGWSAVNLWEVWIYRELLYFLIWRDIKVRYKQTVLGAAWAIIKPCVTMVVFSIIFGDLLTVPSNGVPYPVFAYTALLPWILFSTGVAQAGTSLVSNAHLISKVYFPRLFIPIANVLGTTVDFVVAFVLLLGLMLFYTIIPGIAILMLPFFLILALISALGVGLWLAALQVKYRDFAYITPFLIQIGLFVTPIAYPITIVPARWQAIYSFNPMVVVVEGFRWALLGAEPVPVSLIVIGSLVAFLLSITGLFFFSRTERDFADVV